MKLPRKLIALGVVGAVYLLCSTCGLLAGLRWADADRFMVRESQGMQYVFIGLAFLGFSAFFATAIYVIGRYMKEDDQ